MKTMRVRPAEGRMVPDPDRGDVLPSEGRTVPKSQWWMRRLRDGDVLTITAQAGKRKGAA